MKRLVSALAFAASVPLLGCAGATQNVRAYRAYAYESPSLVVALDRVDDLQKSLELVDTILLKTPYTPGDTWVEKLPLQNAEAAAIRAELKGKDPYSGGDYEVPVLKIYRVHLERVLADVPTKGDYPSLLDAIGSLSPDAADIKTHWGTFLEKQKIAEAAVRVYETRYAEAHPNMFSKPAAGAASPQELAALKKTQDDARSEVDAAGEKLRADVDALRKNPSSGEKRVETMKGATAAVSVAYRIELEALAMIPIIAVQTVRALPKAAQELKQSPAVALKGIQQLSEVPAFVSTVKETMTNQSAVLDLMTESLAKSAQATVQETPGFALKDSVVDQVVGVTLDSLRVKVHAGAEAFFFTQIGSQTSTGQQSSSSDSSDGTQSSGSTSYDFEHNAQGGPGRQTKVHYDVKPIILASANLNIALDWIKLPDAANLNIGYKTDRVFSSGGTIQNGSLANQLGVKGVASDALDLGLGVVGVVTSVRLATFTAGTVTVTHPDDTPFVDQNGKSISAPFQINYTQIDVGYDVAFLMGEDAGKAYLEQLVVGARYFRYAIPRILYLLEDTAPAGGSDHNYVFAQESPIQQVPSRYYMGGVTARFGGGQASWLSPFFDFGFYLGGGPTAYFFLNDPQQSTLSGFTRSQENVQHRNAYAGNAVMALGLRVRVAHPSERLRLSLEAQYRGELLYAYTSADTGPDGKPRSVDFGGKDVFHGPRLNIVGEFFENDEGVSVRDASSTAKPAP